MDRPRQGSWQGLTTDLIRNAKVVETKFYEGVLLGIKIELVNMEDRWYQPRGKGVCVKVCVGRRSTGSIYRGYESPHD